MFWCQTRVELWPFSVRVPRLASNFSRAKWHGQVQNLRKSQNFIWLWGLGCNETARPFQSISSPWTWVALPWANWSRTPRGCQTRRRTVAIKANHCKLWVRSSGQQNINWVIASPLSQPFANTVVPRPINGLRKPQHSEFTGHMIKHRALRLTFRVQSDAAECKIYESDWKIVIYNFGSITRFITRRVFLHVSCWFIRVFHDPTFLLIRGSLVNT